MSNQMYSSVMRGTISRREDAIRTIMETGQSLGLAPEDERKKGGLQDPTSRARAQVIVDTNAGLAAGYIRHCEDMTLGARLLYPCKELVRSPVSNPKMPRDWRDRWRKAGGKTYGASERMIALVEDPIWSKLSRFGSPYPPFDYNSGMITVPVSYDEAASDSLGVIPKDYKPVENLKQSGFNDDLTAQIESSHFSKTDFKNMFGDQVLVNEETGTVQWRSSFVRDKFKKEEPFEMNLGKVTKKLMSLLPDRQKKMVENKSFTVTDYFLRREDKNHGYKHFEPDETDERNIPLKDGDFDMLPTMWRDPDRVIPGGTSTRFILEVDTLDGGTLRGVVDVKGEPLLRTFYKKKK